MQDEYDPSTVRAWDNFAAAVKHLSRDFLAGFAPKPAPSALWLEMTRMQNASALQAASIQYPSNFSQPSPNFSPIAGAFAFLGL